MKHFSTPAWTFGNKRNKTNLSTHRQAPGPTTYNTPQQLEPRHTHSFGLSHRAISAQYDGPGPGSYQIPSFTHYSKLTVKKHSRARSGRPESCAMDRPGPGSYRPQAAYKAPCLSMGNKTYGLCSAPTHCALGPGHYEPDYNAVQVASSFKIGTGQRRELHTVEQSQGNYNIVGQDEGPFYAFPRTNRFSSARTQRAPAPGDYPIASFVEESRQRGKSMAPKTSTGMKSSIAPGPGAYTTLLCKDTAQGSIPRAPRFSQRTERAPCALGPVSNVCAKSCVGNTFGKALRLPIAASGDIPGPGAYYVPRTQENQEEVARYTGGTAARTLVLCNSYETPGPGQYSLLNSSQCGPTHIIGTGQRHSTVRPLTNPGPGHYSHHPSSAGPIWSFSRGAKHIFAEEDDPGPGDYEIPSTVPDVPRDSLRRH